MNNYKVIFNRFTNNFLDDFSRKIKLNSQTPNAEFSSNELYTNKVLNDGEIEELNL
jgi:hypothetical protein